MSMSLVIRKWVPANDILLASVALLSFTRSALVFSKKGLWAVPWPSNWLAGASFTMQYLLAVPLAATMVSVAKEPLSTKWAPFCSMVRPWPSVVVLPPMSTLHFTLWAVEAVKFWAMFSTDCVVSVSRMAAVDT